MPWLRRRLLGRCDGCKKRIPDTCFEVSDPRARYLPKLQLNHVDQLSLGASEMVLNAGLPPARSNSPERFEIDKIIA